MESLKTFEEWNLFKKKELTPDEEYQKQKAKAKAQKDRKINSDIEVEYNKRVQSAYGDPYDKTEDLYGEEDWNL